MNLDDLSVSVRSIFGYDGIAPQDPGVSIGTEPSDIPGTLKVRYDGQTANTKFGKAMFDADFILKGLFLGRAADESGQIHHFEPSVQGYKSLIDRYVDAKYKGSRESAVYITPKNVSLKESSDGGRCCLMMLVWKSYSIHTLVTPLPIHTLLDLWTI